MRREELRQWLLENAFTKSGKRISSKKVEKNSEICKYLIEYTSFFVKNVTISQRVIAILNGQTELYSCLVCGNKLHPKPNNPSMYCSPRCARISPLTEKKVRTTNLKLYGDEHPMRIDKFKQKHKQTNLGRYGVEYSSQSSLIKDKKRKTCLERYGVECNLQHDDTKNKIKQTNLERYGVECTLQHDDTKNKIKQTNLKKYGVEYASQSEVIKDKIKKTNLEKYGTENVFGSEVIKDKIKKTNLERYGVKYPIQKDEFKLKSRNTCIEKYGVEYVSQSETVKAKIRQVNIERYGVEYPAQGNISDSSLRKLKDENYMYDIYVNKKKSVSEIASCLNIGNTTINRYLRKYNIPVQPCSISRDEKSLADWLIEQNFNILQSNRTVIAPKELDIYLPDHNFAIEYNGVYWHTEQQGKGKYYHLSKTKHCEEQGIQLLHIFSSDDLDIWKSVIFSKLGRDKKIGARQTEVVKLSSKEANQFCQENHLQGGVNASLRLGLTYNDTLVSVMTFGKSRFNKNYEWELLRFCTLKGYQVMGGASKLLKHSGIRNCVSYANRRWSNGKLYESIGFEKIGESAPNYFYTKNYINLHSRNQFQKHKLSTKLENFDRKLTEYQNMLNNGYDRIWDCGNLVYEYRG